MYDTACCLIFVSPAQFVDCLKTNNSNGLPFFQGYGSCETCPGAPNRRIHHQHQAIISSYKFNCCGNITEWGVDLNPVDKVTRFTFDFQVWRPSPTVNETGCYSLVNRFIVRSTSLPTTPIISHVARVTPSPQDQLQFQPGDVIGFYVESHSTISNNDNGVVVLNIGSYTSELVWFGHIDVTAQPSQYGSCPYPVGTNGVLNSLTYAAPVISLSIATYSCSSSTTNLPHPSPTLIQSTPTEDIYFMYPGNKSSNTSTTSITVLILGVTLPVIILVGVIVIVTILITVTIMKYKNPTNARRGSSNSDQKLQYVYYSTINTAHSIQLEPNVAYATHLTT